MRLPQFLPHPLEGQGEASRLRGEATRAHVEALVAARPRISARSVATVVGCTARNVRRHLNDLVALERIRVIRRADWVRVYIGSDCMDPPADHAMVAAGGRMAQTTEGARKNAAKRIGLTLEQYEARVAAGEKWCTRCKAWQPIGEFGKDGSRADGLSSLCVASRAARKRAQYVPRDRERGKAIVPARDGDKLQARRRVNYFVEAGLLDDPNDVACVDCGHHGTDRRHEYDHHLGYAAANHEHVEACCAVCHRRRTEARGELVQARSADGTYARTGT